MAPTSMAAPAFAGAHSLPLLPKSRRTRPPRRPHRQRNARETPEALYMIIYSGKSKMPGFGQDCAPRVRWMGAGRLPVWGPVDGEAGGY
jgi:hypothetical protein